MNEETAQILAGAIVRLADAIEHLAFSQEFTEENEPKKAFLPTLDVPEEG